MHIRILSLTLVTAVAGSLSNHSAHAQRTQPVRTANFSVQDDTMTPEGELKSGSYSIRIADHLADRMIVEIQSVDGRTDEKFLGVPARNLPSGLTDGPAIVAGAKRKSVMRGFTFTGGSSVEFVYLKKDAVALAEAANSTVLAVDPASDGLKSSKDLSPEDMRIITLWMLTPTAVGPGQKKPGISAAKYQSPSANEIQVAAVQTPESSDQQIAMTPVAKRPAVLTRLPKTASDQPLLMLFAGCLLALAIFCRQLRSSRTNFERDALASTN